MRRTRELLALQFAVGFVVLLYGVELLDTVLGHRLDAYGIRPRAVDGLDGIVFAPLLHASWSHLLVNTVPLLILGFLLLLNGVRRWLWVTAVVWVVGGAGTWLLYGGLLFGVLPGQPGVSWQGHLFGALGGALTAWWWGVHDRSPARDR